MWWLQKNEQHDQVNDTWWEWEEIWDMTRKWQPGIRVLNKLSELSTPPFVAFGCDLSIREYRTLT